MYLVVESYELTGRHTYFATAISAGCALVLLLSLATLHKNLAPKSKHNKDKDDDDLTISATCKLSFVVTESEIPGIITSVLGLMHMLYYNGCMLCPLRNGYSIRESVDSLCRDGADTPRPPYIGNACARPNATFVSLFSRLTVVLKCFCT